MIAVSHLVKCFGAHVAVDDVSFEVAAGDLFALLGPNGAGKSTTLACLLGFEVPDGGHVTIAGIDVVAEVSRTRRHVAYIPEQVSVYESFSGVENVAYFAALSGHRHEAGAMRELLTRVGLHPDAHDRPTATYSKGMRQKVGIAIALAKRAEVLLLDEPTSGLDPSAAHEFAVALGTLRNQGVAILMATHDLFRTLSDASTIGIMRRGRLVARHRGAGLTHARLERLYLDAIRAVE